MDTLPIFGWGRSKSSTDRATSLEMLGLNSRCSLGIITFLSPVAASDLEPYRRKPSNRLAIGAQSLFFGRFITVEHGGSIIHGIVEDVKMNRRQSPVADGLIMLDEPLKSRIFRARN